MAFIVILLIVMTIVISSWPRKPKSELEIEPQEKIIVEKGFEDEIVEAESLSEEISLQDVDQISELETIESIDPEDEEIEDMIQTRSIKQKGVIRKTSMPQVVKSEPEVEAEDKKEETVEIEAIEPIIIDESDLDTLAPISIEDQPDSLFEQETVEITSIDPIIWEDVEEIELSDTLKVELGEIEERKEAIIEPVDEAELPSVEVDEVETVLTEIEQEKEKNGEVYFELTSEVVEKETEILEPPPSRRVRRPVIDESDPDLKIDLGVETCPHCGSKVPNTIYCIYCGKSLEIEEDSNQL
jgi:hypothetical protein